MTALQYFRFIAKQFASVSDEDVTVWLSIATLNEPNCLVGDRANLAQALYAAHLMQLDTANTNGSGGRGNIKSEREGDLSRSYGSVTGDSDWLGSSGYGQQFKDMTAGCYGGGIMTRFDESNLPVAPWADDVLITGQPRNLY